MRVALSSQAPMSLRPEPVQPRLAQPGRDAAGLAGDIEMPGPVAGLRFEARPVRPVSVYAAAAAQAAQAARSSAAPQAQAQARLDLVA
jgi:hypothetical protein